jgi:CBS domain-containing protein
MKEQDPVSHVMTTNLKTVQLGQKLSDVRRMLTEHQIHHVPVVDGHKLVGLISATDMLRLNIAAANCSFDDILDQHFIVGQIVQKKLVTIGIHETVRKAAQLLSDGMFHSLPVVDKDNNLVGIITSTDLIRYLANLC